MKLIRVINNYGFKTYCKEELGRVTHKGKTYLVSRFIDYPKTNVLTLRKQKLVLAMIAEGASLEEISKITGVRESTIAMWYSHHRTGSAICD